MLEKNQPLNTSLPEYLHQYDQYAFLQVFFFSCEETPPLHLYSHYQAKIAQHADCKNNLVLRSPDRRLRDGCTVWQTLFWTCQEMNHMVSFANKKTVMQSKLRPVPISIYLFSITTQNTTKAVKGQVHIFKSN